MADAYPQKVLNTNDDINPNVLQSRASNPDASSWVSASAGSGKTKVLTERILRLLMPDKNGISHTQPHKILALTFTKAGASEMALRIQNKLGEWVIANDETLYNDLKGLLLRTPSDNDLQAARRLFAEVTDTPGGLKIMTINSFCQSVLSRFPLEAKLSPQFKAIEESEAQGYINQALDHLKKEALSDSTSPIAEALHQCAEQFNEKEMQQILSSLISERHQIKTLFKTYFSADGLHANLCKTLGIDPTLTTNQALLDFSNTDQDKINALYQACQHLSQGSEKGDQPKGRHLQNWLEQSPEQRAQYYQSYKYLFLKKTDDLPLAKLCTAKVSKPYPETAQVLQDELTRILDLEEKLKSITCAQMTHTIFIIAECLLDKYEVIKKRHNVIDYDDQILKTLELLSGQSMNMSAEDMSPWVRFKLDQGIDHILVDEAQDTNSEQWEIIQYLTSDFFDGDNASETNRTIFVVGDEKQSIFSFRRASPDKFNIMRRWFQKKIETARKNFDPIDINISFRSVSPILELVDKVFETPEMKQGLGENILPHKIFRSGQPGAIELWPLFENEEKQESNPWNPPITVQDYTSGAVKHAAHIAETIKGWLDHKEPLESHDRPIKAGDIMILVRARNAFVGQLVKALKTNHIPVSGVDRMKINDEIAVQDLLSAGQFALLPDDDLNLACLLKSPFVGWDDNDLFNYAHNRERTLWQSVKNKCGDPILIDWLETLIKKGSQFSPYEFFNSVLQEACPNKNKSGLQALQYRLGTECLDPIDEFLNLALDYSYDAPPSLQGFVHNQLKDETIIKREMEEAGNAVRIMTVHGSKGLQAPIVVLPDTIRISASIINEKIIWPDRSKHDLPYFIPKSSDAPSQCVEAINNAKARNEEEYKRLLYVAMTRAESRLYVGGHLSSKKPLEDSWYYYIQNAFDRLGGLEEITTDALESSIKRYKTQDSAGKPDRKKEQEDAKNLDQETPVPQWLFRAMPKEPSPPRPLVPSRPSIIDNAATSPLSKDDKQRFKRGNITHTLLQFLPNIPESAWKEKAALYVSKPAHALNPDTQKSIVDETLSILHDPEFAPLFGEGSQAEVSVTGMLDDKTLISGQIDRLLVTDNEIMIIDFKTNRPPPTDEKDVPKIYRNQLAAYARALLKIYPNRTIKTALLWTDGPRLMPLKVL